MRFFYCDHQRKLQPGRPVRRGESWESSKNYLRLEWMNLGFSVEDILETTWLTFRRVSNSLEESPDSVQLPCWARGIQEWARESEVDFEAGKASGDVEQFPASLSHRFSLCCCLLPWKQLTVVIDFILEYRMRTRPIFPPAVATLQNHQKGRKKERKKERHQQLLFLCWRTAELVISPTSNWCAIKRFGFTNLSYFTANCCISQLQDCWWLISRLDYEMN